MKLLKWNTEKNRDRKIGQPISRYEKDDGKLCRTITSLAYWKYAIASCVNGMLGKKYILRRIATIPSIDKETMICWTKKFVFASIAFRNNPTLELELILNQVYYWGQEY